MRLRGLITSRSPCSIEMGRRRPHRCRDRAVASQGAQVSLRPTIAGQLVRMGSESTCAHCPQRLGSGTIEGGSEKVSDAVGRVREVVPTTTPKSMAGQQLAHLGQQVTGVILDHHPLNPGQGPDGAP
jgi:hypothetical protein